MMYAFIRAWARIFLRLYFRKTIIKGLEKVPLKGPLILASNHPSAFLEASILSTVMKRPIHFLVRGDMFHPRFHWLFEWTKQIPIYRQKDGIANLRKNAESFDLTHRKLANGESVLIFPEAKTTLEKKMRPIQRGTAHLAFGTIPLMKDGEQLMIQPVGVNFTEPRLPGTDVVVRFGEPFASIHATRDDREAIDAFTQQLSDAMSPLIVQVYDQFEKNYDVLAAIYFRLLYDNRPDPDVIQPLHKIAAAVNDENSNQYFVSQTAQVLKTMKSAGNPDAVYFPDLILFNKFGLIVMAILKLVWLIAGGWMWRLVRNTIYGKIKTNTFQAPTTVGIFMVVMPLFTLLVLAILIIVGCPWWFILIWLLIMLMGTLVRPSLKVITGLISIDGKSKSSIARIILDLRKEIEKITAVQKIIE